MNLPIGLRRSQAGQLIDAVPGMPIAPHEKQINRAHRRGRRLNCREIGPIWDDLARLIERAKNRVVRKFVSWKNAGPSPPKKFISRKSIVDAAEAQMKIVLSNVIRIDFDNPLARLHGGSQAGSRKIESMINC